MVRRVARLTPKGFVDEIQKVPAGELDGLHDWLKSHDKWVDVGRAVGDLGLVGLGVVVTGPLGAALVVLGGIRGGRTLVLKVLDFVKDGKIKEAQALAEKFARENGGFMWYATAEERAREDFARMNPELGNPDD